LEEEDIKEELKSLLDHAKGIVKDAEHIAVEAGAVAKKAIESVVSHLKQLFGG
jgi:ElaB/YqjD/DUF883 family membrane-anchored ribosome-binding protein